MAIEIHEPELEALILQRMERGGFRSVEDVLKAALADEAAESGHLKPIAEESLAQMFAKARGLLTDEEVDTLFRRDPAAGRAVDLL